MGRSNGYNKHKETELENNSLSVQLTYLVLLRPFTLSYELYLGEYRERERLSRQWMNWRSLFFEKDLETCTYLKHKLDSHEIGDE